MSDDIPISAKMTARDKAKLLHKMGLEAVKLAEVLGAEACIVIGVFKDGNQLIIQDAGKFPMPPTKFYNVMIQAHLTGQLDPLPKAKNIKHH